MDYPIFSFEELGMARLVHANALQYTVMRIKRQNDVEICDVFIYCEPSMYIVYE